MNEENDVRQLLEAQLQLGESITTTAQMLQFVLQLSTQNLQVLRQQLINLQALASTIEPPPPGAPPPPTA